MTKFAVQAEWDETPHLSKDARESLLAGIPAYQRDARTKGIPQLGSGAIYPIPESEILCDPFRIPDWMPQAYALDVGWNRTAALWGALDRDADVLYLYAEYYGAQAEPAIHAHAVRSRGNWIPGVIDPAARGRGQKDGEQLLHMYRSDLGLTLSLANNSRESGIYEVLTRLSTGRIKVFRTLQNFLMEYRLYRRDEKGNVVKENDHLMDDMRYLVMSGLSVACVRPPQQWTTGKRPGSNHQADYDPLAVAWQGAR